MRRLGGVCGLRHGRGSFRDTGRPRGRRVGRGLPSSSVRGRGTTDPSSPPVATVVRQTTRSRRGGASGVPRLSPEEILASGLAGRSDPRKGRGGERGRNVRPPGEPKVHTSRRRSTRLETRTEESNGCASEWVEDPIAERKQGRDPPGGNTIKRPTTRGRHRRPAPVEGRPSRSACVGTRKAVIYPCARRSRGKPRWRPVDGTDVQIVRPTCE